MSPRAALEPLARPLRHAALAFRFLTRLPVPGASLAAGDLGRALGWFPLPGAALGALLAGGAALAAGHVAPLPAAAALVGALAWLTGGLHLDGVADVADGLSGGRGDRERTLAIMRDSRIGAHGAAALVLVLIAKVAAVAELLPAGRAWALVAAPAVARYAAVPLVTLFPYARAEGLGRPFREAAGGRALLLATALVGAVLAAAGWSALPPAGAALATALALALAVRRRLGGLTGDVYGAAVELAELAFLLAAGLR